MAYYVIHDADGNIIRTGHCSEEYLEKQVRADNEFLLPNVIAETYHKVDVRTKTLITEGLHPPMKKPIPTHSQQGISDERLRVMIYQVLMEIEDAKK